MVEGTPYLVMLVSLFLFVRFRADGRPNDQSSTRYAELLQPLARAIKEMYPGWRMRIYHNVTLEDSAVRF